MRVLHVTASGMLGGTERLMLDLMIWQQRQRLCPTALLTLGDGPLLEAARQAGLTASSFPLPERLALVGESGRSRAEIMLDLSRAMAPAWHFVRALRCHIATFAPDIVHSHSLKTHALLALARVPEARLLWHVHDYLTSRHTSAWMLRALARRCDAAIANSRSVADDVRRNLPRVPVTAVLNAVDVDTLSAPGEVVDLDALAGLPAAPAGTLKVGLMATFARWKGHETFLRALANLRDLPLRGYVIGAPVYQTRGSQYSLQELQAIAQSLGLTNQVGFCGFVADRSACLRALDVVVHASTSPEPFGLVVAEAMAAGRPVVTCATGGAAELVRPGIDALTCEPSDPQSLADAVRQLVTSTELRERLVDAARRAARERFGVERLGREVDTVYASIAGAKAA